MHELVAQFAPRLDSLRPRHHEGIADAAAMGVLLVAAQRRVRRHRPAMRKIAVRVRAADIVDPPQLFRHRLGTEIIRPHRIDEAERPALLAGAVVGQHEDQRVVADAGLVEKRDQPRQMLVGMVEHAGKRRLQPREHALSRRRCARPTPSRRHCARGILVSCGTIPIAFWRAMRCSRSTSQPWANIAS